jgi:hypothetical protein
MLEDNLVYLVKDWVRAKEGTDESDDDSYMGD